VTAIDSSASFALCGTDRAVSAVLLLPGTAANRSSESKPCAVRLFRIHDFFYHDPSHLV
jgi:hypothetical protein